MSQAANRAAAVAFLNDYAADADIGLQVYRARPASLYPPAGFVDRMGDETAAFTSTIFQHTPTVEVVIVWGLFDSGEAVDQRDAFVDGLHEWMRTRFHQAGAASLIGPRAIGDEPGFVPDWLPEAQQKVYYATRLVLEGFATD